MEMSLLHESLSIIFTAMAVALTTELISWVIVYRTSGYKRVKDELDRHSRKLESFQQQQQQPGTGTGTAKEKKDKKEKKLTDNVRTSIQQFNQARMKVNMLVGLANMLMLRHLATKFEGVAGKEC